MVRGCYTQEPSEATVERLHSRTYDLRSVTGGLRVPGHAMDDAKEGLRVPEEGLCEDLPQEPEDMP